MIAQDQPLESVLSALARMVERQYPEVLCSVSLLRDGRLEAVPAHGLPEYCARALDELPAPPGGHGRGITVTEIARLRDGNGRHGTGALHEPRVCWSIPISSGGSELLGYLAVYLPAPRRPTTADLEFLDLTGGLAGIAVEHRRLIDELAYRAHHDPLTRIPNRILFQDRLQQAVSVAGRYGHSVGLLYMDLDRFKLVNDLLGHAAGDALLQQVARRLQGRIRRSDTLARVGGDEFAVLLPQLEGPSGAARVARDLVDVLHAPFHVDDHELFVSASIGLSLYPQDGREAEVLERKAALAMYHAKNHGKNNFQCFAEEMRPASPERLELELHLRRALERGELSLHYQPQVELESSSLAGVEALLRWNHNSMGMISPATFVPIAEETGIIVPIGAWVVERACLQARAWQSAGRGPAKVAVNVSPLQFDQRDFVEGVARTVARTGLEPHRLELELTESLVMRDIDEAARRMDRIRALGARISIDDFGMGHSSLSYLQRLPIDTLKIDRGFVREIKAASDRPPLVQAIIALAHGLEKQVIAEGVETGPQAEALRAMGCDQAQGFYFGGALAPEDLPCCVAAPLSS
jgi:diguanylate cyclase (GGDEF)-like protein